MQTRHGQHIMCSRIAIRAQLRFVCKAQRSACDVKWTFGLCSASLDTFRLQAVHHLLILLLAYHCKQRNCIIGSSQLGGWNVVNYMVYCAYASSGHAAIQGRGNRKFGELLRLSRTSSTILNVDCEVGMGGSAVVR